MSLIFGLLTALGFGAGDFLAGLASRRVSAVSVSLYSQLLALLMTGFAVWIWGDTVSIPELSWGFAAGLAAGLGYARYYRALAYGAMGWVATITGVFSAMVPFWVGIALGERPAMLAVSGVFLVTAAVFLVVRQQGGVGFSLHAWFRDRRVCVKPESEESVPPLSGLLDSIIAGSCFGFSFVFLGLSGAENPLWPVLMTLLGSVIPILILQFLEKPSWRVEKSQWATIAAAGLCQALGFLAFALAVRDGLISIVSVAGALTPVPTTLLARFILGQELRWKQIAGIAIALFGIVLIVAG
jgi:drug/metabolite transporter (DMT)-like permease